MPDLELTAEQAKELATRERIAKHNGVRVEDVPTASQQAATASTVPAAATAHRAATFEEKVLARLTAVAVFTGILAVVAIVGIIVSIATAASATSAPIIGY